MARGDRTPVLTARHCLLRQAVQQWLCSGTPGCKMLTLLCRAAGYEEQAQDLSSRYMEAVTGATALANAEVYEALQQAAEQDDEDAEDEDDDEDQDDEDDAYSTEQLPGDADAEEQAGAYATQQPLLKQDDELQDFVAQSNGASGNGHGSHAADRELPAEPAHAADGHDSDNSTGPGSPSLHGHAHNGNGNGNGHGNGNGALHSSHDNAMSLTNS